ncbi:MAG: class I SAM-dependent methyltransferase [Planctomycetota bacterium]
MPDIQAYSHTKTSRKISELVTAAGLEGRRFVDVGAGEGYLAQMLGEELKRRGVEPADALRACDLHPENFKYGDVPCDPIDANGTLPYDDDSFDVVTCIEVVEHVENHFHLVRELGRIVRPGGRVLVTTPNVLNINSRLRFLHSGFGLLFSALPLGVDRPVHSSGHIHPVSYYYLAHGFHRSGFGQVGVHFDRYKKSGIALAVLLWLPVQIGNALFRMRLRRKKPDIYEENRELLRAINSFGMLTARTIIVEGVKASGGADQERASASS